MLNGTETIDFSLPAPAPVGGRQGAFPDSGVRHVYLIPWMLWKIHSKYVRPRKVLKGSIKLETSESVFFCRAFPLSLWGASLLAVARGGTLCQLGND